MTIANHPATPRLRKTTCAALVAAAIAIGNTALGFAATASADPNNGGELDVEAYDACMEKTLRDPDLCCIDAGGVLKQGDDKCYAPTEDGSPGPPRTKPPVGATVILPPGANTRVGTQ
jgi:hypothetical protein